MLTVLMPVYNCEAYLHDAINSILSQTYSDFIFYIVDDGSSDNSAVVVEKYVQQDKRIKFFRQKNKGLIDTLNTHLPNITTKYVARMDGDDVCDKNRLELQLLFLEKNKEIGVVGTGICYMNHELREIIYNSRFPATHNLITWAMLYKTGIGHANLMMRTELFKISGGYNKNALHVEDYEFFLKVSKITKLANLNETLYKYRRHDDSVSLKYEEIQKKNHFAYSKEQLKTYIPGVTDDFVRFLKYDIITEKVEPQCIFSSLKKLYKQFTTKNDLSNTEKKQVKKEIVRKMYLLAAHYKSRSLAISLKYFVRHLVFKWSY